MRWGCLCHNLLTVASEIGNVTCNFIASESKKQLKGDKTRLKLTK